MTVATQQRIVCVCFLFYAGMVLIGCGPSHPVGMTDKPGSAQQMRISALSEFVRLPDTPRVQLKAMTELLDASGQPVRQACIWRFELYRFDPHPSNVRGNRLMIWPDLDLTVAGQEEAHWKVFLKGYEFYLPLEYPLETGKKYVLEATAMTDQRRYNDLFEIRYTLQDGQFPRATP